MDFGEMKKNWKGEIPFNLAFGISKNKDKGDIGAFSEFHKNLRAGFFDIESAFKENRIICHPNDYKKFAEKGVVKALTDGGIEVVQSDLVEEGKQIATGELAVAIFDKWKIK